MKLEVRDRARLVRELIVAEALALPGRGPLARKRWSPVPPPAMPMMPGPRAPTEPAAPRARDVDESER